MRDVGEILADLERRVRGLKSNRPVRVNQIALLAQAFPVSPTLASGAVAAYEVTVVCAGAPLVDISYDGFAPTGAGVIPSWASWVLSGNTAVATCELTNTGPSTQTRSIIITAWGLNGLSASIRKVA